MTLIFIFIASSCLFTWCHAARFTSPLPQSDQVHLSLVEALVFQSDRNVTRKDGSSAHEMECVAVEGGRACFPHRDNDPLMFSVVHPSVVVCRNEGYNESTLRYRWSCSIESNILHGGWAEERHLVDTEVLCDGVHHAHDPVVLHATCRLRYQLMPPPPTINVHSTVPVGGTVCRGTAGCRPYAHIPPCPLPACTGQCGHQCMEYAMDWEGLTILGRVRDVEQIEKHSYWNGYYTIDIPWQDPMAVPTPPPLPPKQDIDAPDKGQPWTLDRVDMVGVEIGRIHRRSEVIIEPVGGGGGSRRVHQFPAVPNKLRFDDIERIIIVDSEKNNKNNSNATDTNNTSGPHNSTTSRHYFPDYWLKGANSTTADSWSDIHTISDFWDAILFCVYQLCSTIWGCVRFVPLVVVRLVVIVLKIIMTLLIGFITGDPIDSFFKFVAHARDDLVGGLGAALLTFIVVLWQGTANMMLVTIVCALLFMAVFALCSGAWCIWMSFTGWYYERVYRLYGDKTKRGRATAPISSSCVKDGTTCIRTQLSLPEETLVKRDQVVALLYGMTQSLEPDVLLATHNDSDAERCLDYLDARQTRFVTKSQPAGSRHEQDGQWFFCTKNNNGASLFTQEAYRFVHHVLRSQTTQELEQSRAVTGALVESFCKPIVLPLPSLPCTWKNYGLVINPRAVNRSLRVTTDAVNRNLMTVHDALLTITPLGKCDADAVVCSAETQQGDVTFSWVKKSHTVTLVIVDVMYTFRVDDEASKTNLFLAAIFNNESTHQYVVSYKLKFQSILDRLTV